MKTAGSRGDSKEKAGGHEIPEEKEGTQKERARKIIQRKKKKSLEIVADKVAV